MDRRHIILTSAACLLAIACSKEQDRPGTIAGDEPVHAIEKVNSTKRITKFYTSFDSSDDTRVYIDADQKVRWNKDDLVSIFNMTTDNNPWKFDGKTGARAGGFDEYGDDHTAEGDGIGNIYAVYPYRQGTWISAGEVLNVDFPETQHYAEGSLGPGANIMVSKTQDEYLSFKNAGGYMVLQLYGAAVKVGSVSLMSNEGEIIAGEANITFGSDGIPSTSLTNQGSSQITLVCDEPVTLGTSQTDFTEFWFVIPPVTFSKGFKVTVTGTNGKTCEKATGKKITIARNEINTMAPLEVVLSGNNQIGDGEEEDGGDY